jgi:uncharacterized membrane protein YozB (DUF420 family)
MPALDGWNVILGLKVAVCAVTLLLLASLLALWRGNIRLHGRINVAFFLLTVTALVTLEVLIRVVDPRLFDYFDAQAQRHLLTHLCFSLPAAALLPAMLFTGYTHRRWLHIRLAVLFSILWVGTVITGVFFLPHKPP